MRDTRTWWRKGADVEFVICKLILQKTLVENKEPYLYFSQFEKDWDNWDCIWEQLWAIGEGMADMPVNK